MNQMKIALLASLYSSLLGAFVIAIEFILIFLAFDSKPEVTMGGIGLSFFYYFMTVVVCFFLAFVFGSPIYKVLRIYSFANFGSSATIGIIFILCLWQFKFSYHVIPWLVAGSVTGMFYHYIYKRICSGKNI